MSEKSGTSENLINKPSGGGAVKGIGETFSPDLFSGTGNFSVPISVPQGRNNFQPQLTIGYSTGNGNGPYGLGWGLSIPGVMRKTSKGIPVYQDETDVFILSGAEDLIPIDTQSDVVSGIRVVTTRYQPRTEGLFARILHVVKSSGEDYWEVRSKDGLISLYGNPDAIGASNTIISDPENQSHIYQWLLFQTIDPMGNKIEYGYERDLQDTPEHIYNQLYLKNIRYNYFDDNGTTKYLCSVEWEYENRPDPHSSYRSGFEIRTTKRCKSINTYTHPNDIDLPQGYSPNPTGFNTILVKTYHFQYLDEQIDKGEVPAEWAAPNAASILTHVQVEGDDAGIKEQLPPLEFGYSRWKPEERDLYPIEGDLPAISLARADLEMADLNGNGLPDLIQMTGGTIRYWENLSNGRFGRMKTMNEAPLGLSLADNNVQLMDSNGDGRIELFVNKPSLTGYFSLNHNGVWDRKAFQPYKTVPTFSMSDPQVKLLDLTGNGTTDVLRNGERLECFFQDREGFKTTRKVSKQLDNNLRGVNFADPRMRLADLSGDGLQDLVLIDNGRIVYWPNLGYGNWGRKVTMKNAPRFDVPFDPSRLLIGDIDGDGQSDLVYVQDNKVVVCINQSGNGWADPLTISGTPSVSSTDSVRLVDLNGTGVSGILWSYDAGARNFNTMYYLDFTRGVKPYVLNTMNNNMGAITHVEYISSVFYYLRDNNIIKDDTDNRAWSALTRYGTKDILPAVADRVPWKTTLPSPTQVVARTEVIDQISLGKLVTVYNYHHGYWDGYEREFRGFGRVDQYDTETFERFNAAIDFDNTSTSNNSTLPFNLTGLKHFSPPLYTKNWFNVGPVQTILSVEESFQDAVSDFIALDYTSEFWQEDQQMFTESTSQRQFLNGLPRKAKRDALRTLRGTAVRQEVYALDGTPLQSRPYTVTESQSEVRLEYTPPSGQPVDLGAFGLITNKQGSGYIFFPFGVAQRTTQWERGTDPMYQVGFTGNYDEYGQPSQQIQIGVPRGKDPATGNVSNRYTTGDPYLATWSETQYIYKNEPSQYMVTRVKKNTQKEVINQGAGSIWQLKSKIDNQQATLKTIGCSVMYYDGSAFVGLPFGEIGEYGQLVRTETLVIDQDQIDSAYPQTPPCFENTPDWSGYPAGFQNEIPNNRLGHLKKQASSVYEEGFYTTADRKKYDFQVTGSSRYGLVIEQLDVFDGLTRLGYDDYGVLLKKVTPPLYLQKRIRHDYRTLQIREIIYPNFNRQKFTFSPLGLVKKVLYTGDSGQNIGDTFTAPSVLLEYDFFAFKHSQQPVYVKTIQREYHISQNVNNKTITAVEYSDGFGRLLQTRTQAEDTIYGNAEFGTSGLPNNPDLPNQNAVGITRSSNDPLNVLVSGWKVYNNKGKEVEVYEPFFASGFDFESPLTVAAYYQNAQKAQLFYDPRGQVIRTKNPDNTQQLVIPGIPNDIEQPPLLKYPPAGSNANTATGNNLNALEYVPTPWESCSYDPNDLGGITHPQSSAPYSSHWGTPKSAVVDALGRTLKTIDRLDAQDPSQDIVMQYTYDIRGNLLKVTDPYDRTVFEYRYNYANQALYTNHIDSGISRVVYDALGQPVIVTDAKGAESLSTYDNLSRPLSTWAKDKTGASTTLRMHTVYGDAAGLPNPQDDNLRGQPYLVYDESGLTEFSQYDFKGNLLTKLQQVISNDTLKTVFDGPPSNWDVQPYTVDWTGLDTSILDGFVYATDMSYDALNRIMEMELPEDVSAQRKKITPNYNTAGTLKAIECDGTQYVSEIAYNAKGQRLLIAYGNEIMTRYAYNPLTFRLQRYRSERFSKSTSSNQITYTPQSGTARQDLTYSFDLVGNILTTDERITDCGISGTTAGANQLIRQFTYDPIYRLLTATGRETDIINPNNYLYDSAPSPITPYSGNPVASDMRAYTRKYSYDKLGNIEQVNHAATGSNYNRNFSYNAGHNTLDEITSGGSTLQAFTYDNSGNQMTSGTTRKTVWNAGNMLKAYFNQSGTSEPTVYAQYLYDAGGNRIKKLIRTQGGDYETVVYIDELFIYHQKDGEGEKNEISIKDDKSRIACIRVGDTFTGDFPESEYYVLEDHLGSSTIRLKHTPGGTKIDREEYYPFGDSSLRTFDKKKYRYVGKEKDAESGLYYYGARYYAAWICRFISVDPLASQYAHLTPYNNASNNPVNFKDIDGMQTPQEGTTPNGNSGGTSSGGSSSGGPAIGRVSADNLNGPIKMDLPVFTVRADAESRYKYRLKVGAYLHANEDFFKQAMQNARSYEEQQFLFNSYIDYGNSEGGKVIGAGFVIATVLIMAPVGISLVAKMVGGITMASAQAFAIEESLEIFSELAFGFSLPFSPTGLVSRQIKKKAAKESAEVTLDVAKQGKKIVGSNFDEVLPTQNWINPNKVAEYKKLIIGEGDVKPILAYKQNGKIYIENGHHRFTAYKELGVDPKMIVHDRGGPVGLPNWKSVEFEVPSSGN